MAQKPQQPTRPKGMHQELADDFFGTLSAGMATENGYDKETDYRRFIPSSETRTPHHSC